MKCMYDLPPDAMHGTDYRSLPKENLIKGPSKMQVILNKTSDFIRNHKLVILFSIFGVLIMTSLFAFLTRSTTGTPPNYCYVEYDNHSYKVRGNVNWGWDNIIIELPVDYYNSGPNATIKARNIALQYAKENCFIK